MGITDKPLDDYEYKVKIQEVNPDTGMVLLVFEEVDGLDGFGVEIHMDELKKMKADGRFEEWVVEQVEKRIELLESIKAREEAKKKLEEELKAEVEKEDEKKERRVKPKRAMGKKKEK